MAELTLEQAVYVGAGPGQYKLRARSPSFRDKWLAEAERLCDGFGERPTGMACPACVFVQPIDKRRVAVVQVADQPNGELGFYLLVIHRLIYELFAEGDPFYVAGRCPPPWQATAPLMELSWPDGTMAPPRTVADVQRILKRDDGPTHLGAAQALVDGGHVVFERSAPDTALLREVWALLPTSTRAELWPASFVFGNALGFHALVVPSAAGAPFEDHLREEQAGDYPEGRYELDLQFAAEAGDQRELDRLFARRSRKETFRLGLMIVAASLVILLVMAFLNPQPEKAAAKPAPTTKESR